MTDQVVELSVANDWKVLWKPWCQGRWKAITYTVKEVAVPEGYKVTVNDKTRPMLSWLRMNQLWTEI